MLSTTARVATTDTREKHRPRVSVKSGPEERSFLKRALGSTFGFAKPRGEQCQASHGQDDAGGHPHHQTRKLLIRDGVGGSVGIYRVELLPRQREDRAKQPGVHVPSQRITPCSAQAIAGAVSARQPVPTAALCSAFAAADLIAAGSPHRHVESGRPAISSGAPTSISSSCWSMWAEKKRQPVRPKEAGRRSASRSSQPRTRSPHAAW
jgi:hypothetical protein